MRFSKQESDSGGESPLVRCEGCGFQWYGPTAAHGLSVLGRCSRCGGELRFRSEDAPREHPRDRETPERALQPWQVLGAPTSWAGD